MTKPIKPYVPTNPPLTREQKTLIFVAVQTLNLRWAAQDKAKKKGK